MCNVTVTMHLLSTFDLLDSFFCLSRDTSNSNFIYSLITGRFFFTTIFPKYFVRDLSRHKTLDIYSRTYIFRDFSHRTNQLFNDSKYTVIRVLE